MPFTKCDLSRYLADRAGYGRNQDPGQYWHRLAPGNDQNRSFLVFGFGPPDLTLRWRHTHQGSSVII